MVQITILLLQKPLVFFLKKIDNINLSKCHNRLYGSLANTLVYGKFLSEQNLDQITIEILKKVCIVWPDKILIELVFAKRLKKP